MVNSVHWLCKIPFFLSGFYFPPLSLAGTGIIKWTVGAHSHTLPLHPENIPLGQVEKAHDKSWCSSHGFVGLFTWVNLHSVSNLPEQLKFSSRIPLRIWLNTGQWTFLILNYICVKVFCGHKGIECMYISCTYTHAIPDSTLGQLS